MKVHGKRWIAGVAAVLALAPGLRGEEPALDVQAELKALRAEVADLKAQEGDSWLNQRRKEEIKSLVHEVLADAETRASMQENALVAGWNKNFFLASEDGNFLLKVSGQSQTRYIHNTAEHDPDTAFEGGIDEQEGGFQQRRTKLTFDGHVFDPKFKYEVTGAFSRSNGNLELEIARFEYEFADGWSLTGGTYKTPFLIEETMSSKRFQAVERSFVNDYFTIDYTQGAHLTWAVNPNLKVTAGIHDGSYARSTEFNADSTEYAVASRVEYLVFGDIKQFSDYQAWSDTKPGLVVGGGVDYEVGEHGQGSGVLANGNFPDVLKWTADVRFKLHPVNIFAAYVGQHIDENKGSASSKTNAIDDATQHGFVVQAGVFIVPDRWDLFARYEFLDFDGTFFGGGNATSGGTTLSGSSNAAARSILAEDDTLNIVTVGTNYYFGRHDMKLTFDAVYFLDPMPVNNLGAGMVQSSEDNQLVIRGQFQFLF